MCLWRLSVCLQFSTCTHDQRATCQGPFGLGVLPHVREVLKAGFLKAYLTKVVEDAANREFLWSSDDLQTTGNRKTDVWSVCLQAAHSIVSKRGADC